MNDWAELKRLAERELSLREYGKTADGEPEWSEAECALDDAALPLSETLLALIAENEALLRQIDTLTEWYANALNEIQECSAVLPVSHYMDPPDGGDVSIPEQSERDQLRAEVETLRKDAERLTWLINESAVVETDICVEEPRFWVRWPAPGDSANVYGDPREAIDAAMTQEGRDG